MKQFIEVGEIVATFGIKGEVKIYPWCDSPSELKNYSFFYTDKSGEKKLVPQKLSAGPAMAIAKFEGCETVEQARTLIKTVLYVSRSDIQLEAGRHFVQDLIGLNVIDAQTKRTYGRIVGVTNNGAHSIFEIAEGEKTYYFPAVSAFLQSIDIGAGAVFVNPIGGMFDDEN